MEKDTQPQTPCVGDPHLGCSPYGVSSSTGRAVPTNHLAWFLAHDSLSRPLPDQSVERTKQEVKLTVIYMGELIDRLSQVETKQV